MMKHTENYDICGLFWEYELSDDTLNSSLETKFFFENFYKKTILSTSEFRSTKPRKVYNKLTLR